jgi:protein-S-isoprenylcysteine O-methyltransferase Ste14
VSHSLYKLIYFIELVLISVVRSLGTTKYRNLTTAEDRGSTLDTVLLALNGIGMIVPMVYVFSSIMDFADFSLPDWLRWFGIALFAVAGLILWMTHRDLGRNWTPTPALREDHTLVTEGIYKHIRHPMYTAHLLWAIAQPLILANWIAGFSFLAVQIPQYLLRIKDEEQMMLDKFGAQYQEYMNRTGRFFPRVTKIESE